MAPLDPPTITVIIALLIPAIATIYTKFSKYSYAKRIAILTASAFIPWIVVTTLGEFILGWATANVCYAYLGCNIAFAGYDAFEHALFGLCLTFALLWMSGLYPAWSIVFRSRTKTIVTIVAYAVLISVCWEIIELIIDVFRTGVLHEHLLDLKRHIDELEQSSNNDTMGDLIFAMFGTLAGLFMVDTQGGIRPEKNTAA